MKHVFKNLLLVSFSTLVFLGAWVAVDAGQGILNAPSLIAHADLGCGDCGGGGGGFIDLGGDIQTGIGCKEDRDHCPEPPEPASCTLSASPASLSGPGNVTISWDSENVSGGFIDPLVGSVNDAGSQSVFISQTTTFNGSFSNSFSDTHPKLGHGHCSVTVIVAPPPPSPAPSCTLTLTKDKITWTSQNATSVDSIDPQTAGDPQIPKSPGTGGAVPFSGAAETTLLQQFGSILSADALLHGGITNFSKSGIWTGGPNVQQTLDHVCELINPDARATAFTSRAYNSPSDNSVVSWDGTNWMRFPADNHNSHLNTLTCTTLPTAPHYPLSGMFTFNPPLGVGTHTYEATVSGPGGTATCQDTVVVPPPPPPQNGCIQVKKETFDPTGAALTPVAQFSFTLDGTQTTENDANGDATFANVAPGTHTVAETPAGPTWTLLSVTPANGSVTVMPGPICSAVVFKNKQVVPSPNAPTCTLNANPTTIVPNATSTLSWTTTNAASVSIDNGIGAVTPVASGSHSVSPGATTAYTLTAKNAAGATVACHATVTVVPPGNGCIDVKKETFDPSGNILTPVAQFTFTLDGTQTTENDANGNAIFSNLAPGTHTVAETPAGPTWTLLSVTPAGGSVHVMPGPICSAVVFKNQQVIPPPQTPSCTLDALPSTLASGGSSTLSWTTNDITSASIDNGVGTTSPVAAGSATVTPRTTTTYTLSGTGPDGSVTCHKTIVVNPLPPGSPSCTLSASPASIASGGSSTLSWTSTNAVSFSLDHGIGTSTPASAGTATTPALTADTTFTGTATSATGETATCTATVAVVQPSGPLSCTLSADPLVVPTPGASTLFSWTTTGAVAFVINNDVGTSTPVAAGSVSRPVVRDSTFTGTAFDAAGHAVQCSVAVSISPGGGGGCIGSCGGGGGVPMPTVALFKRPGNEPLAFVSLAQIPYTGFEAGPALTAIFWLAVAGLSAFVAYLVAGRGSMRYVLAQIVGGFAGIPLAAANGKNGNSRHDRPYPSFEEEASLYDTDAPAASAAAVAPAADFAVAAPTASAPVSVPQYAPAPSTRAPHDPDPLPLLSDVIESRAHAAGVLMSPEAVSVALGASFDRAEGLRIFGRALDAAVKTLPREDGWIMLTAETLRTLIPARPSASAAPAAPLSPVNAHASAAFALSILSGERERAFGIIRSLEHDGIAPTALMTGTASALDALYRARRDGRPAPDAALAEKAASLSNETVERIVVAFAHASDHVYASPFTGAKLAVAQAFEALA